MVLRSRLDLRPIARELIYDSLFEDESFAALPDLLARSVGGRTSVIHWLHPDQTSSMLSHSPYFSHENMAEYSANYAGDDLWSLGASRPGFRDRVWDANDLVPDSLYERSRFYNDWIRGMGDDTYHCMGVVMTGTRYGTGMIGIHRGRAGKRFDQGETKLLENRLPDLKRLLNLRGRLQTSARAADNAQGMLNAMRAAALAIDRRGRLIFANAPAEAMLRSAGPLILRAGQVEMRHGSSQALRQAIDQATGRDGPAASNLLLPDNQGGMLSASIAPMRGNGGVWHALLLINVDSPNSRTTAQQLQSAYRLTPAEAEIAIALAQGLSSGDISDQRGTTRETVRSQIKVVMAKMDCNRQSQVAARVMRVAG